MPIPQNLSNGNGVANGNSCERQRFNVKVKDPCER